MAVLMDVSYWNRQAEKTFRELHKHHGGGFCDAELLIRLKACVRHMSRAQIPRLTEHHDACKTNLEKSWSKLYPKIEARLLAIDQLEKEDDDENSFTVGRLRKSAPEGHRPPQQAPPPNQTTHLPPQYENPAYQPYPRPPAGANNNNNNNNQQLGPIVVPDAIDGRDIETDDTEEPPHAAQVLAAPAAPAVVVAPVVHNNPLDDVRLGQLTTMINSLVGTVQTLAQRMDTVASRVEDVVGDTALMRHEIATLGNNSEYEDDPDEFIDEDDEGGDNDDEGGDNGGGGDGGQATAMETSPAAPDPPTDPMQMSPEVPTPPAPQTPAAATAPAPTPQTPAAAAAATAPPQDVAEQPARPKSGPGSRGGKIPTPKIPKNTRGSAAK
ncbi:hypothetical protein HDV00_009632 [Rhizophlyctis rosea]|nr:hypothetical protein HDV00_009632 [Rhizophlyctis rosea]